MRSWRIVIALAALLTAGNARAQSKADDRWQLTLENGDYVWDIKLVKLDGQDLVYSKADSTGKVAVSEIHEVRRIHKSEVHVNEGAAGSMAALTGSDDELYDLGTLDFDGKLRAIRGILQANATDAKP